MDELEARAGSPSTISPRGSEPAAPPEGQLVLFFKAIPYDQLETFAALLSRRPRGEGGAGEA